MMWNFGYYGRIFFIYNFIWENYYKQAWEYVFNKINKSDGKTYL